MYKSFHPTLPALLEYLALIWCFESQYLNVLSQWCRQSRGSLHSSWMCLDTNWKRSRASLGEMYDRICCRTSSGKVASDTIFVVVESVSMISSVLWTSPIDWSAWPTVTGGNRCGWRWNWNQEGTRRAGRLNYPVGDELDKFVVVVIAHTWRSGTNVWMSRENCPWLHD